jgi:aldose sugar dehydrogenase
VPPPRRLCFHCCSRSTPSSHASSRSGTPFVAETLATGLEHPWGLAFLPDGGFLVTERPGRLRLVSADGSRSTRDPLTGLPSIAARGQGGLLDVALHPDFANNRLVYLSYSSRDGGAGTRSRAAASTATPGRCRGHLPMTPKAWGTAGQHFGSRLAFDRDGYLFITLGDRGRCSGLRTCRTTRVRRSACTTTAGCLPTTRSSAAATRCRRSSRYGHRNIQGAGHPPGNQPVCGPTSTGPQGGDEINLPEPGATTAGRSSPTASTTWSAPRSVKGPTGRHGAAVVPVDPVDRAVRHGLLHRRCLPRLAGRPVRRGAEIPPTGPPDARRRKVVGEERLLDGALGRIRDVRQGPDGLLYLLTDAADGHLVRLRPAD